VPLAAAPALGRLLESGLVVLAGGVHELV
jgi:hypothetical protein